MRLDPATMVAMHRGEISPADAMRRAMPDIATAPDPTAAESACLLLPLSVLASRFAASLAEVCQARGVSCYQRDIRHYRNECETFPSNLIASSFGFQSEDYFNVEAAVREVPSAEFA